MADGSKSAPALITEAAAEEVIAPNLAQRMAAIRAEAFGVGKQDIEMTNSDGKKWKIKAHTVEAVLSEIRPLLDKHGVGLIPMLVDYKLNGNLCLASYSFEFMDLASGEVRAIPWAGAGTDKSDKALAKAGTNALKEMLKKVFLITDRDDAKEEEEKVEHQTDGGLTRAQTEQESAKAKAAIAAWSKAFKASVESARTARDIDRLFRDARDQLDAIPDVTREFFEDLRTRRKADMASVNPQDEDPA